VKLDDPVRYGAVVNVVDDDTKALTVELIEAVLVITDVRVDVDVIVCVFEKYPVGDIVAEVLEVFDSRVEAV
jgi:hypothetical protein